MPRRIQRVALESFKGEGSSDTYFDRIVKYVPADVVAAWTAVAAAVKGAGASVSAPTVLWICFIFGVIITPLWVLKQTDFPGKPKAYTQALVATLAFIVWVFALGEPFSFLSFYNGLFGTLAIIGFTLISGLIVPKET
jgi:hypothetical protein